ncbi:8-oxo-dGTP diphosphatase [Allocatelliglobosispora scoriae]|uniref:8-oxo-dGTP diphosphatase n=1 Tax=Allocatelliglobosispora scoriae TaxID=643052 RepID=A0A841BKB8_9ACTN|nr:8-oxo-dGTP diphosphatase [Allocatelliglobosispora scoriae]MBB5867629.1 8-oxo-dGTP diphosphatase [Allocatelliglobosispora scoriae]
MTSLMPVVATLAYVVSPDRRRVLLIHRDKRPGDIHFGKHLGLGGRVERDEDVVSGVVREIAEESGLVARDVVLRGTVSWTGFGKGGQDWFCFVFRVDSFEGEAHGGNDEGTLVWTGVDELDSVPMWESDALWLPMVFDDEPPFHGYMPYRDGEMVSWSFSRA